MEFPPGVYVVDYSKNYVARTTRYTGTGQGQTRTYVLVQGLVIHPLGNPMCNSVSLLLGPDILIAGHGAMSSKPIKENMHIHQCRRMAENMAAFRLDADGDGAIWHRVRAFYIGC